MQHVAFQRVNSRPQNMPHLQHVTTRSECQSDIAFAQTRQRGDRFSTQMVIGH
ncbi:Uncharacterised protein [Salmonella enterica subsp. enterica serovar Typhi]|nr:Uncharacterised protein [Salmonella enterica subsp. enterica serovar Typhi]